MNADIDLIVLHLYSFLLDEAKSAGVLTKDVNSLSLEERQKYVEFTKKLFFVPVAFTERGLADMNSGHFELAEKMFQDAVAIDDSDNDYWQSYFCLGSYQFIKGAEEDAKKTFLALQKKNPLFKNQMDKIFKRVTSVYEDEVIKKLKAFIVSVNS